MLKIAVDFNALSPDGEKVWINTKHLNIEAAKKFKHDLRVLLYEPDMEVEAILRSETDDQGLVRWYGIPDWSSRRDILEE
jgi:hypothetical protein